MATKGFIIMTESKTFLKKDTLTVKGIAIILLLFYHLFESDELITSMSVDYAPFSKKVFLTLSGYSNICVAIFVFLSAYGITKGLMDCSAYSLLPAIKQAYKRALKLIVNFAAMYISVNLLWFRHFDYTNLYGETPQGLIYVLLDALGLSELLNTPTLNMTWWYMKLALSIIFLVPFLFPLLQKLGKYMLVPAFLLPFIVTLDSDVSRYFLVICLAMVTAYEKWFEKIFAFNLYKPVKLLAALLLLALSVLIRQNYIVHSYFLWIVDAPIAFLICLFSAEFVSIIPGISLSLSFLGKHSMNIFFVHTFFYMILYREFIYSFKYSWTILLVLIAITLVYSILLEMLKSGIKLLICHLKANGGRAS